MKLPGCKMFLAVLPFLGAMISAPAQETNAAGPLDELRSQITTYIEQPRFNGALWGIKIVSLDSGKTLFESNAGRLMSPASNCKLYIAALALDRLGGDYRISTPVYVTMKPDSSGTVQGDLVVVGHGDATLNPWRLGTNFWDIFEPFVTVITHAGIRGVTGDLVADATFFHGRPAASSLTLDDFQNGECPAISALTLDDGVAHVRVEPASVGEPCRLMPLQPDAGLVFSNYTLTVSSNGAHHVEYYLPFGEKIIYVLGQTPLGETNRDLDLPVLEPAKWFATGLKDALARHGLKVSGEARAVAWPQNPVWNNHQTVKVGEVLSPPLREIVRLFLKSSQNLETDTLLAHLGETTRTPGTPAWRTSEELGLGALHQFLVSNNLPASEVLFNEGSGLSADNLATANSVVALLQFMWRHPAARDFMNALPVAAVDGSLRERFQLTPAAGNLRAKTGSLSWASSLSGYVTSAAGEHLAFSLMLNRYPAPPNEAASRQLDAVALMLADFSGRPAGISAAKPALH
jgi:D-alanyl-D-alanine carboxypeptidase/D-alanyl-D-alanine-endopeptidase (penicillin-binding protein 4)